jgi:hypothetical protein
MSNETRAALRSIRSDEESYDAIVSKAKEKPRHLHVIKEDKDGKSLIRKLLEAANRTS